MALQQERIVVIDDTEVVRRLIVRVLERSGFTVLGAADGEQGLELIRSSPPALVLCDLRMPGLDGLDVLRCVREESADMPFIVMSGEGLLEDAVGALKLGAWDYLAKPLAPLAIEHAVHRALEKAALIRENRNYRANLELLNRELQASLSLLADDEAAGRQIQIRMLPRNHQRFGEYTFARDVVPSAFLSGDFIDAFAIDQRRFGFYLADVSGHGVSSALVTVLLRTFVQRQVASLMTTGDDLVLSPARLLQQLNEEMARDDLEKNLTIFYGIIDQADDTLLYANAGQFPWPILYDDAGAKLLERPSVPVGMVTGTCYEEHRESLGRNMSLSVCSDGVLEVLPHSNLDAKLEYLRKFFGRLDVSVEQAHHALNLDVGSLPDDVALLIVQRGGINGYNLHS